MSMFSAENASLPQETHGQIDTTWALLPIPSSDMPTAASALQAGSDSCLNIISAGNFLDATGNSLLQNKNQARLYPHSLSDLSFDNGTASAPRPAHCISERHESLEHIMHPHIGSIWSALNVLDPDCTNNTATLSPFLVCKSISEIKDQENDESGPFKRQRSKSQDEDDDQDDSTSGSSKFFKRLKSSNRTSSGSSTRSPTHSASANTNGNSELHESSAMEKKSRLD